MYPNTELLIRLYRVFGDIYSNSVEVHRSIEHFSPRR